MKAILDSTITSIYNRFPTPLKSCWSQGNSEEHLLKFASANTLEAREGRTFLASSNDFGSHLIMFDTFFCALLRALILVTPAMGEDVLNHPTPGDNNNGNNDLNTNTSSQPVQWQTAFWC